jgi:hypothetical protein
MGIEDLVSQAFHTQVDSIVAQSKPYFSELDTKTFLRRFAYAIIPRSLDKSPDLVHKPDLYGPLVLTFALSAAVHFQGQHRRASLGIALFCCFVSLLAASGMLLASKSAKFDQALCMVGYSFSGPLLVVIVDKKVPWMLFVVLGGALELGSAFALAFAVFKCCSGGGEKVAVPCFLVHLVWLWVLRGLYA